MVDRQLRKTGTKRRILSPSKFGGFKCCGLSQVAKPLCVSILGQGDLSKTCSGIYSADSCQGLIALMFLHRQLFLISLLFLSEKVSQSWCRDGGRNAQVLIQMEEYWVWYSSFRWLIQDGAKSRGRMCSTVIGARYMGTGPVSII